MGNRRWFALMTRKHSLFQGKNKFLCSLLTSMRTSLTALWHVIIKILMSDDCFSSSAHILSPQREKKFPVHVWLKHHLKYLEFVFSDKVWNSIKFLNEIFHSLGKEKNILILNNIRLRSAFKYLRVMLEVIRTYCSNGIWQFIKFVCIHKFQLGTGICIYSVT